MTKDDPNRLAREIEWTKSQLESCSEKIAEWISLGFSETAAVEAKWAARYANQYTRLIEASK